MNIEFQKLQAAYQVLSANHNILRIERDELRAKQDAFNTTHDALLNKIIALRTERDELSAKLNEREQLIGELYGAIHTLQKTNPVSVEIKRLSALLDANDIDNTKLHEKIRTLTSVAEIKDLRIERFKITNDELRASYDVLDKKCSDGITKLGAAREEIRNLNEEINENNNIVVSVVITKKPRITLDAR